MKPYKLRPTLPWYLEKDVHGDINPFNRYATPAGILAYINRELPPEATTGLLAAIIDAGASQESMLRDGIELAEMGHEELAEQVIEAAYTAPVKPLGITETDFLPELMKTADEVTRLTTAAITKMKIREQLEGIPVQLRED